MAPFLLGLSPTAKAIVFGVSTFSGVLKMTTLCYHASSPSGGFSPLKQADLE